MKPTKGIFFVIFSFVILIVIIAFTGLGPIKGTDEIRYGIDIRGGVEVIFVPKDFDGVPSAEELARARTIIEGRLDRQNILDREITVDERNGSLLVRFPWKSGETDFNPEQAISELGEMAQLTFRDEDGNILLTGSDVARSAAQIQESGWVVTLEFTAQGAQKFANATGENIGKPLLIFLDDALLSAPTVEQKIVGSSAQITGSFTAQEAGDLSATINAGSLPFSLSTQSFSTISPYLSDNALQVMLLAGALALGSICLFMLLRYRLVGLISSIALCFQTAAQLLLLSISQITLTLPGIAGLVLSIGMGVDANIIIAERIGDELREGKPLRLALIGGYHNAFSAVLDGNLTTLIVAVLLMIFGSGTMLSFGYTLTTGIAMNFIAGVFSTRIMLFSLVEWPLFRNLKFYRIGRPAKERKFFEKRKVAYAVSALAFAIGLTFCCLNGVAVDTQFKGGIVLKYSFTHHCDTQQAAQVVESISGRAATIQTTQTLSGERRQLVVTLAGKDGMTPEMQSDITHALKSSQPKAGFSLAQSFVVEPYIGSQALADAIIAVLLAAILIVLYIWVRFRRLYGLSAGIMALLALAHDALVVFFAFAVAGFPVGDSFVAVLLTIIGYSINDTIVIYDRIRENRSHSPHLSIRELANKSISDSLTRSVFTSLTTLGSILFLLAFALWYGMDSIITFALPMVFGLISGCYSSVCIAGPLWAAWQEKKGRK